MILTVLPLRSHGGLKLSTMQSSHPSSDPIFSFRIVSNCASDTSTGSLPQLSLVEIITFLLTLNYLKTIQVTDSNSGGVVREPG